jgi:hypothetical protein
MSNAIIGTDGKLTINQVMIDNVENKLLSFEVGKTFYFVYDPDDAPSQYMLEQLYNAIKNNQTELLLNLALKYNKFSGIDKKAMAEIKYNDTTDTYEIIANNTIAVSETSFNGAIMNLNAAHQAVALCYQKSLFVKDVIAAQVKQVEEMNEEIAKNGEWWEFVNKIYDEYYKAATEKSTLVLGEDWKEWAVFEPYGNRPGGTGKMKYNFNTSWQTSEEISEKIEDLHGYLKNIGGDDLLNLLTDEDNNYFYGFEKISMYNSSGQTRQQILDSVERNFTYIYQSNGSWSAPDAYPIGLKSYASTPSGKLTGFDNIDVDEELNLTKIRNTQEFVRMHGDELVTDAQMMSTRLTQLTQDHSNFLTTASQICKSFGDNYLSITSNIRT